MRRSYKHDYASLKYKLRDKIWNKINPSSGEKGRRLWLYPAWYHYLFFSKLKKADDAKGENKESFYLTQSGHRTSGIGVNIENNWSGYRSSMIFGVKYAYSPLPDADLDKMLSMGDGEIWAKDLLNNGFRKVKIPYFDISVKEEIDLVSRLMGAYNGEKVLFVLEDRQTLPRKELLVIRDVLKRKFWEATSRKDDPDIYPNENVHIAMHIRRGDIGERNPKAQMEEWWLDNNYYIKLLDAISSFEEYAGQSKEVYIISEGTKDMFADIEQYASENGMKVFFVLNEKISISWLYMIKSDILFTGSSSFSYTASFFHKGLKISPLNRFIYPLEKEWLLAQRNGEIIDR